MSGQRLKNFSKNPRNSESMYKNTIVKKGWYYRSSPIIETNNLIGIVIEEPMLQPHYIEKLKYSRELNSYSVVDVHEVTLTTDVLWNNNVVETCALKNLVEVK